jgi:hypothetical protein
METKPPLRQRPWYAVLWCVLILISGSWTLNNAYLGYQLVTLSPSSEVQGLAALGCEVDLVMSIPIYILFIALLFNFPTWRDKGP